MLPATTGPEDLGRIWFLNCPPRDELTIVFLYLWGCFTWSFEKVEVSASPIWVVELAWLKLTTVPMLGEECHSSARDPPMPSSFQAGKVPALLRERKTWLFGILCHVGW